MIKHDLRVAAAMVLVLVTAGLTACTSPPAPAKSVCHDNSGVFGPGLDVSWDGVIRKQDAEVYQSTDGTCTTLGGHVTLVTATDLTSANAACASVAGADHQASTDMAVLGWNGLAGVWDCDDPTTV
jgi:hypothetical protein